MRYALFLSISICKLATNIALCSIWIRLFNNFLLDVCSGVSSFNQFIHELSVDSDTSSSVDYLSEEDSDDDIHPGSPLSQSSRLSRRSSFTNHNRSWIHWIRCILSWLLFPLKLLLGIPLYFFTSSSRRASKASDSGNLLSSNTNSPRRSQTLKDHIVQRATDRRRGVVEVWCAFPIFFI